MFQTTESIIQSQENLKKAADVLDVTDSIKTSLLINSEDLSIGGRWTKSDFKDPFWQDIKIPKHEITYDKNFSPGNFAYYRILIPKIEIDKLKNLENEIFLALQIVNFSRYEAVINGQLFSANSGPTPQDSLMNLPLQNGVDNLIAIKAKISASDTGIVHRRAIFIGKGSVLTEIYRNNYKGGVVFPFLFIFSMGSILFMFSLIYFELQVPVSFEKFLLFGLCCVIERFCTSDELYKIMSLAQIAFTYSFSNIGACIFLSLFFSDVTGKKISSRFLSSSVLILIIVGILVTLDTLYSNYFFNFDRFLPFWNTVMALVLVTNLPKFLRSHKILALGVASALVLILATSFFTSNIGLNYKAYGSLILFFVVAYETFRLLRTDQDMLRLREKELLEQQKDVAIGKTAAVLAHDVRRPLEQMRLVLDRVTSGDTSAEFLEAAKRDVEFSLSTVNNQISDIMNFSRNRSIELTETSFYRVLSSGLKQVMAINPNVQIKMSYEFEAKDVVLADESRLAGIITNLLTNAVEAIRDIGKKNHGQISLKTKREGEYFVFRIFNDGPEIPEEHIARIYDPLFSFGKPQGTGIGLASVYRAIQDHKGKVEAANLKEGVVFKVSLLAGLSTDQAVMSEFLSSSEDYSYKIQSSSLGSTEESLRVLVLDDDSQVYDYFHFLSQNSPVKFALTFTSSFQEAADAIKSRRFDLYVLDFDLDGKETGLDFYKVHLPFLSREVILHTNRDATIVNGVSCQHSQKPISPEGFYKILEEIQPKRPKILVVDDSALICLGWQMFHGKHNCDTVRSPDEALAHLAKKSNYAGVVVDYFFDNSSLKGDDLAKKINESYPLLPVMISSSADVVVAGVRVIKKTDFDVRRFFI